MSLLSRLNHPRGKTLKLMACILVLALLSVAGLSLYFNRVFANISQNLQETVIRHQEGRIRAFLQEEALFYLNKGNYALLEEYLEELVADNPLLAYIIISDAQRRIIAGDAGDSLPGLQNYLDDPALWVSGTRQILVDGRPIINSTSIIPGMRRLQFGIWSFDAAASVREEIAPVYYRALFVTSLGLLISIAAALYAGTVVVKGRGGEAGPGKARIAEDFNLNELDQLSQIFNDMMAALDSNWQENTRLQQQLHDRDYMRSQFLKRVIAAQEGERKRISRELHDQTSQSLTSLMLGLRAIQDAETMEDVQQYTREYRNLLARSLEEIQNLAFELRPSALDDLGLVPALKRYVQELARRKNLQIDLKWQDYPRDVLGEAEETIVYRVVQESLTNIVKHAGAKKVKIRLKIRQGSFVVFIKDDGRGFDTHVIRDKDPENLGIFGMKERAQLAGGRLYIGSRKNRGTMVMLVLPLKYKGVA